MSKDLFPNNTSLVHGTYKSYTSLGMIIHQYPTQLEYFLLFFKTKDHCLQEHTGAAKANLAPVHPLF